MSNSNGHDSERQRLLMAYGDGEVSAAERARVEVTLTDEERKFVEEQRSLALRVMETLGTTDVPEPVWKKIREQIQSSPKSEPRNTPKARRPLRLVWAGLAAAVVLLGAGIWAVWPPSSSDVAEYLRKASNDQVADLESMVEVSGDRKALASFLARKGLPVDLEKLALLEGQPMQGQHKTTLLGAKSTTLMGEPCVALLFNCCGNPVQILLVPKTSRLATVLDAVGQQDAVFRSNLTNRELPAAHAVFVSRHDSRGLLDLLG